MTSIAYENGYASRNTSSLTRAVKYRPTIEGSGNEWTNPEKAFDGSTAGTDRASYVRTITTFHAQSFTEYDNLILNVPNIDHSCDEFTQNINYYWKYSATGNPNNDSYVKFIDRTYSSGATIHEL